MSRNTTIKIPELETMLTYGRPHGSKGEAAFVDRFISGVPGMAWDKYGNGWLQIGTAPVVWSCHTDTVHSVDVRQEVTRTGHILRLKQKQKGLCLGADDGAGVWLLLEMIRAKVSGLYLFHAGEEHGGLGSAWIAKHRAADLAGYKAAIAFDRKGTGSIITHQGSRTCSDRFARSLNHALGGGFVCDDTGTFTDTAHYEHLIGECTNVSVGYENNHGPNETLDLLHVKMLRDVLVRFDHTLLEYDRQPGEDDWDNLPIVYNGKSGSYDEALIELCRDYPLAAARVIEMLGGNAADMVEYIERFNMPFDR